MLLFDTLNIFKLAIEYCHLIGLSVLLLLFLTSVVLSRVFSVVIPINNSLLAVSQHIYTNGDICLSLLSPRDWKPSLTVM